jgi:hypothetical protein
MPYSMDSMGEGCREATRNPRGRAIAGEANRRRRGRSPAPADQGLHQVGHLSICMRSAILYDMIDLQWRSPPEQEIIVTICTYYPLSYA